MKLDVEGNVGIAWDHNFLFLAIFALSVKNLTSHIRGAEVELWFVTSMEWSMAATFLFLEDVDTAFEFNMWSNRTWLGDNLTTLDLIALDTAEEKTGVITSLTLVESLVEGLDTGNDRFLSITNTNDFNFIIDVDSTLFDTTSSNSTTTLDGEDVLRLREPWLQNP